MKYVFLSIAVVVLIFGCCFVVSGLIRRRMSKKPPLALHILLNVAAGLLITGGTVLIFLNIRYTAQDEAVAAFSDNTGATVTQLDGAYFIDGAGEDTALIFYPGAKVEAEAYLPLMKRLAAQGTDCFLLQPPFSIAFFDMDAAGDIIERYSYRHWLVSGHSLGGTAASAYAAAHPDKVDGVVLLASYPLAKLDDSVALLSIYGSEDGVMSASSYENAEANFPANTLEVVIRGGNHAGFGNYGEQAGDGSATIPAVQQQEETANAILRFEQEYLK